MLLVGLLFDGCEAAGHRDQSTNTYLYLSHTRADELSNDLIAGVAAVDYHRYDMRWLGGDLLFRTSESEASLRQLDDIFQLSNVSTLWSLGNHDCGDRALLGQFTQRPSFYSHHQNGITFLVLDTEVTANQIEGAQLELFQQVCDTLSRSTHLILLHHHLLWLIDGAVLERQANEISNGPIGECRFCLRGQNNFYSDLYPVLQRVRQKGIEVMCIGGDAGTHSVYFEHETADGIRFMASGMNKERELEGEVVIFRHRQATGELEWRPSILRVLPGH
ncbi:MAG: hypothetical protein AAF990_09800 [Bacteroidota bacterium]